MLSVHYGLKANFPSSPDTDGLYFCTDTLEIFKGSALYSQPVRFVSSVPSVKAQGVLYVLPTGEIQSYDGSEMQTIAMPNVTTGKLSPSSTASEVPTAKVVYDTIADYAPLASPALTGVPTAPTAASATDNGQIATTEFVHDVVDGAIEGISGALHFKGVVNTVADLPTSGNTEGDVYQVKTTPTGTDSEYVWTLNRTDAIAGYRNPSDGLFYEEDTYETPIAGEANKYYKDLSTGTIYKYNGSAFVVNEDGQWIELGSVIDLSAYSTSAEIAAVYAPLASPALTGTPTAPTAAIATDNTQIATTEFVHDVVENELADYATLASPTFTGTPAAPTAAKATDSTQIATTEFVHDVVDDYAPLNSPAFTGTPTAPTAAAGTDTTQIATTAFVTAAAAQAVADAAAAGDLAYDTKGSAAAAEAAAKTYAEGLLAWQPFPTV